MTPRERVAALAWEWIGTPYHTGARIKGAGVDCAMLLCEVYEQAGVVPRVDPGWYPSDWHLHKDDERYVGFLEQYGRRVKAPDLGDVILVRFGRAYSHGGIVVEAGNDPLVIHAYLGRGVMPSRLSEEPLTGRPIMYWTVEGLDDGR